jgi:hypothetical protein
MMTEKILKILNPTERYFVKVKYDGERLSITAVDGPMSNGDCRGSSGQAISPLLAFNRKSHKGWNLRSRRRLAEIWKKWHLNDMRSGCKHQLAAGWDKRPIDPSKPLNAYGRHCGEDKPMTRNMLVWVKKSEHPEGLLCEPCPECEYKYGTAWLLEEVPVDILDELEAMPETKVTPAWC